MASDLPPPPPGFTLEGAPRKKRRTKDAVPPPPEGFTLDDPEVTDGDTLSDGERKIRLWGVDAPELDQRGFDRQGRPVPIGEQSRDYLQGEVTNTRNAVLGDVAHTSFGRLVGPVTLDGRDAAQGSIRSGNALAAPDYLSDDPERRFAYMEAERLARLNRLGPMNDTLAQDPSDHRKNPDWVPERETIAQFWDTPTPLQGMRPEAEAEYVALLRNGTAEQIYEFGTAQGMGMDPEAVRAWADDRDKRKAMGLSFEAYPNYQRGPEVIQELGDGALGAGVRGFGEGFVAGGLGELGAVADTLGATDGRESVWNSDRRLADIWANNQYQNESILRGDDYAHPTASTVGEIGGALTSGFVIPYGAGARTVPQLAKVGAVYGGAEGFLGTDGTIGDRVTGAAIGAPAGAIINAVGGKALEAAAPLVARGLRAVTGRNGERPARTAGEAVEGLGEEQALDAAVALPARVADDIPPPPPGYMLDAPEAQPTVIDGATLRARADVDGGVDMRRAGDVLRSEADAALARGDSVVLHVEGRAVPITRPGLVDDQGQGWGAMPILSDAEGANRLEITPRASAPSERTIGMDAEPSPSVSLDAPRQRDYLDMGAQRPRRLLDPATEAERLAAAERVRPGDVLPLPANTVDGVEGAAAIDAGRFVEAKAPNERQELRRTTVRNWMGVSVPKVGPTDLVGWLRLRGGLKDQGGELSHMGLTNASRRGLEHVGQEHRFGPLVNDESGMDFDDAALLAWEEGYFPEFTERPSVSEFLDALRDTYEGGAGRRFLPDDMPELERYEMAQADRYALEQQQYEADGPVWQDRSSEADDAQPFPPVEAYEEWPSDAIKRVGNIDVTKLDSPQDIRRALKTTHNTLGGFDAATRGRITHAETERLASELNMTPEQLLSRRKGQALNAEEALAARQILAKSGNELVNLAKRVQALDEPGDELLARFRQALVRHAAIQEQVAGATAEAGRALQQFRQAASSRAVRGDVLSALVRSGGGKDTLQEAAGRLIEAVEIGPGRFSAVVEKAGKRKWQKKIGELYINFLLSNPATHVVNMTSNTLTAMAQLPEFATAAMIGKARQAFARNETDRVIASEVGARAFGLLQGAKEGARMFARAVRTGEASDYVSKVEGDEYKAIPGVVGEIVRVPTRLLTAEDELFKGIARRMSLNGLAARQAHAEGLRGEAAKRRIAELSANPTDELLQKSMEYGRYLTFQTKLGPVAQNISNVSQNSLIAKLYLPFIRTPTNLLKFAATRSPAAPFMPSWRKEIAAGGARRDLAIARMMLGTGFGIAIYQAALNGYVTGALPSDPKKARLMRADGWQEYSIKIGDTYYSYKRLDPFAMTLGVAADLATLPEGMSERERDDKVALLVMSIMGNLASKTWLSGVSDLVAGLDDPQRNAGNMLERLAGSIAVPAGVAGVARALDPTAREVDGMGEAIMARVPGLRDNLRPRRDIWGEEVTYDSGFLSPAYTSEAANDPVNLELLKLGDYAPGYPSKTVKGRELSPEEYDEYQERAGKLSHERLTALVTGAGWGSMDSEAKVKAAKKTVDLAREEVREALFGSGDPDKPDGGGDNPPPPPRGFSIEGESAGRNVYRDLQEAIPGVRFTSGFRDKAYQADMRARGYSPAQDSAHLDGSSFDLLPPPGKSMGWLKAQVKRYDPNARLLDEGDHLHATFPGYYGAPPLGGARAAGLRNPLAGIPPPPPGFTVQ